MSSFEHRVVVGTARGGFGEKTKNSLHFVPDRIRLENVRTGSATVTGSC